MVKVVLIVMLLASLAGCRGESQTISGVVVDESGVALADVAVTACYLGWGWSGGSLVWDKDYCSDPVLTAEDGSYAIRFDGPEGMRLRAHKEGWIQERDSSARDGYVILTAIAKVQARNAAEAKAREEAFLRRLPGETAADYYCRVVRSRAHAVFLRYRDERLAVTPSLLPSEVVHTWLLAVQGSAEAASAFASEAVLKVDGQAAAAQFLPQAESTAACEADIRFIVISLPEGTLKSEDRIELFVPSLRAMFDVQVWQG